MKSKKGWYILLVVWILLLAAETLSYIGVLPFGTIRKGFLLLSAVGIVICVLNIRSKN